MIRSVALVALVCCCLGISANAQQRICCKCKSQSRGPFGVEAPAGFPASQVCPNSCSTNGGDWTGQATNGACNAPAPTPPKPEPPKSIDGLVVESIRWSIGHQGARVWNNGGTSAGWNLFTGNTLLQAILGPMDPGVNRDRVAQYYSSHGNDISAPTIEALKQCKNEFPESEVNKHVDWVCHHEGNTYNFRRSIEEGRYDDTRSIFSNAEKNDDRVRNVLYCYNAEDILRIEKNACGP